MITPLKSVMIRLSSSLALPRLFAPSPRRSLTILLYHRFFATDESHEASITRLQRQLEWLTSEYTPLDLPTALALLSRGTLPDRPLVVTIDDCKLELLDAYAIFQRHAVPVALFPCVGWTDEHYPADHGVSLSRIVNALHWYEGPDLRVPLGNGESMVLAAGSKAAIIDRVIVLARNDFDGTAPRLWNALVRNFNRGGPRKTCNWTELEHLQRQGAAVGSHTVSHCRLAHASDIRVSFELQESRRIIMDRFAGCDLFAYPYGTDDVVSLRTTQALERAGYSCGLLTNAGFGYQLQQRMTLPRIVIPDHAVGLREFQARVRGGEIPCRATKNFMRASFRMQCQSMADRNAGG